MTNPSGKNVPANTAETTAKGTAKGTAGNTRQNGPTGSRQSSQQNTRQDPGKDAAAQSARLWTTAELRKSGKHSAQIASAVADGRIHRVIPGVYSAEVPTDLLRLRALALGRLHGITYTGTAAAHIYGLGEMTWPATGRVGKKGSRDGGDLLALTAEVTVRPWTVGELNVTSPIETAVDLLAAGWDGEKLRTFLVGRYAGAKGNDELAEDLSALPPRNRKDAADLLDGLVTGTASRLELRAATQILKSLDGVDVTVKINHVVSGYRFDIVIEEADVLVEIDSFAYHGAGGAKTSDQDFSKDRWKGNTAVRAGYTLLRYADDCVTFVMDTVAEQVADTVRYNLRHRRKRRQRTRKEFLFSDAPAWFWHPLLKPSWKL